MAGNLTGLTQLVKAGCCKNKFTFKFTEDRKKMKSLKDTEIYQKNQGQRTVWVGGAENIGRGSRFKSDPWGEIDSASFCILLLDSFEEAQSIAH